MKIASMTVDKLIALQHSIGAELQRRQSQLKKDLEALGHKNSNGTSLKGKKIAPKFRGPNGETWAGRGMQPKWLSALIKKGRKLETYRI
jgi:DNA-binding protein H-NS